MDLRYSDSDEKFRGELRSWLEENVPAQGDPPAPDDWEARRAYEMILRAAARAEQQGNRQDDSPTDPSEADRG